MGIADSQKAALAKDMLEKQGRPEVANKGGYLLMAGKQNNDEILVSALLVMTAVTGLVDAVSFLSLGHVFTANMTGNIVLLAFASTGVPQVSLARSITALLGFLAG